MRKRQPANMKTPERVLEMGNGEFWRFRLDHNAIYELEQHTGRPVHEVMKDLSPVPDPNWVPDPEHPEKKPPLLPPKLRMAQVYDLAYPMTISHREDEGLLDTYPPAELDAGRAGFRRFLRILPHPSQMQDLLPFVMALVASGFTGHEVALGNVPAPSPEE